MKTWISMAFGTAALATAAFASATPAQARSDVGVYIGPGGAAISVNYRHRCRNYWYRVHHPYRCGYGHYYRERYYYPYDYYHDGRWHRRHHHRHHNRHDRHHRDRHDRW